MAKNQLIGIKDAVQKLQLALLDGIQFENQLFAAGSVLSKPDYEDVVVERSIANSCGYPLCKNSLPSERPRKGRYRISLKEHKVYDLHETYMYCSSTCVVNSRAFASSLLEERCLSLSSAKIDAVLRLFGDGVSNKGFEDWLGKNGDMGMSKLKIKENVESKVGEVSWDDWVGPSNAIEGYVPKTGSSSTPSWLKSPKEGSKTNQTMPKKDNSWMNEMDFTSVIITEDEYSISKGPPSALKDYSISKSERSKGKVKDEDTLLEASSSTARNSPGRKSRKAKQSRSKVTVAKDDLNIVEVSSSLRQTGLDVKPTQLKEESVAVNETKSGVDKLKSSLKSSASKKQTCSVTWADEKVDCVEGLNLCEFNEVGDGKENLENLSRIDIRGDDNMLRFASAEACAAALSLASEAVASGESDISDAVSEAGIIILPPCDDVEGQYAEKVDMPEEEPENAPTKWPTKPGILKSEFFDPEDSWYDTPPEGFSLSLSPFAQMWMALFSWLTSSSLAFIYGRVDSSHEDYSSVNGREYPRKITLIGGRSSEIKQTLAGCLARSLPGLVSDLRLPVPTSSLEQGMGHLLETMTFVDALPSLRVKQWQVISLLFLDALSVNRIPALTSHLTSKRMLRQKVLDGAQIGVEEYEVMKDLIIPLGRAPQFSTQSGG